MKTMIFILLGLVCLSLSAPVKEGKFKEQIFSFNWPIPNVSYTGMTTKEALFAYSLYKHWL